MKPTPETGDVSTDAREAESIASMVTDYVEGGLRMGTDWRRGLAEIIDLRLKRLKEAPPAREQQPEQAGDLCADCKPTGGVERHCQLESGRHKNKASELLGT